MGSPGTEKLRAMGPREIEEAEERDPPEQGKKPREQAVAMVRLGETTAEEQTKATVRLGETPAEEQ